MIKLACGEDLAALGIRTREGVNIHALLDHLENCPKCRPCEGALRRPSIRRLAGKAKIDVLPAFLSGEALALGKYVVGDFGGIAEAKK